ncbi:MAG: hypothetical protein KF773_31480 [Deltaproteobacteria bacterium]|nr:hypothetical protein [Deltaproteobacteria bacterium]MCW5802083.1 hypothetical protein [Deltaproteobacteria bacterium]
MQRLSTVVITMSLAAAAGSAAADPCRARGDELVFECTPARGYIELYGTWGFNLGTVQFIPDEEPGVTKHPWATGFGAGATWGYYIKPNVLSFFLDYRYGHTSTRKGSINGVLTNVQGRLNFHEATAGARVENRLGNGTFYGALGYGVLFPYHTTLELQYAPELAAVGITGEGTQKQHVNTSLGGFGEFGYHLDAGSRMYIGFATRIAAFQGSTSGNDLVLTNFVSDFTRPVPVTTTIRASTRGPVPPTTESVQDIRFQVSVGVLF